MLFEGFLNHGPSTNYYYFAAAIRDAGLINKLAPLVSLETCSCQATAASPARGDATAAPLAHSGKDARVLHWLMNPAEQAGQG